MPQLPASCSSTLSVITLTVRLRPNVPTSRSVVPRSTLLRLPLSLSLSLALSLSHVLCSLHCLLHRIHFMHCLLTENCA